jgi:hypothetical protein
MLFDNCCLFFDNSDTLNDNSGMLNDNSGMLNEITSMFFDNSGMSDDITRTLESENELVSYKIELLCGQSKQINIKNESVIALIRFAKALTRFAEASK